MGSRTTRSMNILSDGQNLGDHDDRRPGSGLICRQYIQGYACCSQELPARSVSGSDRSWCREGSPSTARRDLRSARRSCERREFSPSSWTSSTPQSARDGRGDPPPSRSPPTHRLAAGARPVAHGRGDEPQRPPSTRRHSKPRRADRGGGMPSSHRAEHCLGLRPCIVSRRHGPRSDSAGRR
jgi:hypothetical protein